MFSLFPMFESEFRFISAKTEGNTEDSIEYLSSTSYKAKQEIEEGSGREMYDNMMKKCSEVFDSQSFTKNPEVDQKI